VCYEIVCTYHSSQNYVDHVRNPNVSLNRTLARNEKVEHYIRIKTHKSIALMFWVESDVNSLYSCV